MNNNTIKKAITLIITVVMVMFMAFMFEKGLAMYGFTGLILFSLAMAGFRIWKSWDSFKNVIEMGAEQLHLAKQLRKEDKKSNVKKK